MDLAHLHFSKAVSLRFSCKTAYTLSKLHSTLTTSNISINIWQYLFLQVVLFFLLSQRSMVEYFESVFFVGKNTFVRFSVGH